MSIVKKDTILKLSWHCTPEYAAYHIVALRDIDLKAEHELALEAVKKDLDESNEIYKKELIEDGKDLSSFEPFEIQYEDTIRKLAELLVAKGAASWLKTQTHHLGLGLSEPTQEILDKFYDGELTE